MPMQACLGVNGRTPTDKPSLTQDQSVHAFLLLFELVLHIFCSSNNIDQIFV